MKEKRKASRGAANPLAASVRSTSTSPEWISAAFDRISDSRRAVADPVAELREAELQVEHEVRVAEPERHLRELEMVEIGGPGEVVRAVAVPGRRGSDGLVDEAAGFGDACPDLRELVVRRGGDGRCRERAGGDQSEQDGEPAHQLCRSSTALSRSASICVHRRLDLVRALSVLDFVPEVVEIASSSSSIKSWSRSPSGASTRLEVVDVCVADGLLGGFEVSRARLGDGGRKQRLDLPDLGHGLGRCGGLLLGFVGASAAGGHAERKGGKQHGQHGKHGRQSKHGTPFW